MSVQCLRVVFPAVFLVLGGCAVVEGGLPATPGQQARPQDTSWELTRSDFQNLDIDSVELQPWASRTTESRGLAVRPLDQDMRSVFGVMAGDVLLSINGTQLTAKDDYVQFVKQQHASGVRQFVTQWLSSGRPVQRTIKLADV